MTQFRHVCIAYQHGRRLRADPTHDEDSTSQWWGRLFILLPFLGFSYLSLPPIASAQEQCGLYVVGEDNIQFDWGGSAEWIASGGVAEPGQTGYFISVVVAGPSGGCPGPVISVTQPAGFTNLISVGAPIPAAADVCGFQDCYWVALTVGVNPYTNTTVGGAVIVQEGSGPPFYQSVVPNPFTISVGDAAKPNCTYKATSTTTSFGPQGGPGAVNVTATPNSPSVTTCPWLAGPLAKWIKAVTPPNGSGDGTVSFNIPASTTSREGYLFVAGQKLKITQAELLTLTSNGVVLSPDQCTSITNSTPPAMPITIAALTAGSASGPVTWSLTVDYPAPAKQGSTRCAAAGANCPPYSRQFTPSSTLTNSQPWSVDWGTSMVGGTATLDWSFAGQSGTFPFCIDGLNGNPTPSAIVTQLSSNSSNPWYYYQILEQESGLLQFTATSPYQPVFGPPAGYGLSQIDPPKSELDLFSWVQNLTDGAAIARAAEAYGVTFWNGQVSQYNQYLATLPTTVPPPPGDDEEVNCGTFVYGMPPSGQHSYSDAIAIKRYNGLGSASVNSVNGNNYMVWQSTGAYEMDPQWVAYPYTVLVNADGDDVKEYYVRLVCKRAAPPAP